MIFVTSYFISMNFVVKIKIPLSTTSATIHDNAADKNE
jgi:hypothetical protein